MKTLFFQRYPNFVKGQSGVESLLSYGWIILVAVGAIILLSNMGTFKPVPCEKKSFGFSYVIPLDWAVYRENNIIVAEIENQGSNAINLLKAEFIVGNTVCSNETNLYLEPGIRKIIIVNCSEVDRLTDTHLAGDCYDMSATLSYLISGTGYKSKGKLYGKIEEGISSTGISSITTSTSDATTSSTTSTTTTESSTSTSSTTSTTASTPTSTICWVPVTTPSLHFGKPVHDMISYGGKLYVGTDDTDIGGVVTNVAVWDGISWQAMPHIGVEDEFDRSVSKFVVYNGDLYAVGSFAGRVARLNGAAWTIIGDPNNYVTDAQVYNGELYIAGMFTSPGKYVARWNGTTWRTVGGNSNAQGLWSLFVYAGELYATGYFDIIDGKSISNIARWNGSQWNAVGSGLTDAAGGMGTYEGDLYVSTYQKLNIWNGTGWEAPVSVVSATTTTNAEDYKTMYGNLYIGGRFWSVSGRNVARWNGTTWIPVGYGMDLSGNVLALEIYNGELYAGGTFHQADNQFVYYTARLDCGHGCPACVPKM